ncbi:hypothetical protein D3C75_1209670 [compost metagenome]
MHAQLFLMLGAGGALQAAVDLAADGDPVADLEAADVAADGRDMADDFVAGHAGVDGVVPVVVYLMRV